MGGSKLHTFGTAQRQVVGSYNTYIHTYMLFHFINPSKPLGFGYETCPQDLTNTIRHTQIKTYTHTNYNKILNVRY
jgi:hypothetical protein